MLNARIELEFVSGLSKGSVYFSIGIQTDSFTT